MQLTFKSSVAKPPHTLSWYQLRELDGNNIGNEGCIYVSKAQWNKLHILYIGIFFSN